MCMICSMTAFAKYEKKYIWGNVSWEIRSLNQRYLDIYIDMPKNLYGLSWDIRKKIKNYLCRGKIECFLYIKIDDVIATGAFNIDKQLVRHLIASAQWVKQCTKEGSIDPLLVLSWPGVITYKKFDITDINVILLECFEEALNLLVCNRKREGLFLKECIVERLHYVRVEIDKIHCYIPDVLEMRRKKLLEQLKDICRDSINTKLEQELLFITQRIDISEEIDRVISHIKEMYNVFLKQAPVGRQLDFILQELYREVNTISAKSINFNITSAAISLKVLIEQIREQVQNIE